MKARLSRKFGFNSSDVIDVHLNAPLSIGDTFFSMHEDLDGNLKEYEGTVSKVHHFIHYHHDGKTVSEHYPMYTLEMKLVRETSA